jgi:hypothetical protein
VLTIASTHSESARKSRREESRLPTTQRRTPRKAKSAHWIVMLIVLPNRPHRQIVTQFTSTALTTVTKLAWSSTIPSKIPVTHLPPWEQPLLRHNRRFPTGPNWPPTSLPDLTVGLKSKQDGDTRYIPFAGAPLLSGSGKLPESPTSFPPRALGTQVALYSALRCLQLLIFLTLWSIIKTVTAFQIQDIYPFLYSIQLHSLS